VKVHFIHNISKFWWHRFIRQRSKSSGILCRDKRYIVDISGKYTTLKRDAVRFSHTSSIVHQSTLYNIPQYVYLEIFRRFYERVKFRNAGLTTMNITVKISESEYGSVQNCWSETMSNVLLWMRKTLETIFIIASAQTENRTRYFLNRVVHLCRYVSLFDNVVLRLWLSHRLSNVS
jgi:hypothetical protein